MVDTTAYPTDASLAAALDRDHSFPTDHSHLPATSNEGSLGGYSLGIPPDTTEFIGELFDPNSEIVIPNDDGVSSTAPGPPTITAFQSGAEQAAGPTAEVGLAPAGASQTGDRSTQEYAHPGSASSQPTHKTCNCLRSTCMCGAGLADTKSAAAEDGSGSRNVGTGVAGEGAHIQTDATMAVTDCTPAPDEFRPDMSSTAADAPHAHVLEPQLLGEDLHGMWSEDHPGAPYGGDEGELIPNPLGGFDGDMNGGWDAENIQLEAYSSTDTSCGMDGAGVREEEADTEIQGTEREADMGKPLTEDSQKQKPSKSKPIVQCTRELYFAFKAHLEEQARMRVERMAAQADLQRPLGSGASQGGATDKAKPKVPVVGKVLSHAACRLWGHVKGDDARLNALLEGFKEFQAARKTKQSSSVERVGARLPEEVVPVLAQALQISKPVTESWGLKRFMVDFLLVCAMGSVPASPMLVNVDALDEIEKKRAEHVARRTNRSRARRQQWRKEQQQKSGVDSADRALSCGPTADVALPDEGNTGHVVAMGEGYAGAQPAQAPGDAGKQVAGGPHHSALNLQHLRDAEVHTWPTAVGQPGGFPGEGQEPPPALGNEMVAVQSAVRVLQPMPQAAHDGSQVPKPQFWESAGASVTLAVSVADPQGQHATLQAQAHMHQYHAAAVQQYTSQVEQQGAPGPAQQGAGMHTPPLAQPQHLLQQQHMQQQQLYQGLAGSQTDMYAHERTQLQTGVQPLQPGFAARQFMHQPGHVMSQAPHVQPGMHQQQQQMAQMSQMQHSMQPSMPHTQAQTHAVQVAMASGSAAPAGTLPPAFSLAYTPKSTHPPPMHTQQHSQQGGDVLEYDCHQNRHASEQLQGHASVVHGPGEGAAAAHHLPPSSVGGAEDYSASVAMQMPPHAAAGEHSVPMHTAGLCGVSAGVGESGEGQEMPPVQMDATVGAPPAHDWTDTPMQEMWQPHGHHQDMQAQQDTMSNALQTPRAVNDQTFMAVSASHQQLQQAQEHAAPDANPGSEAGHPVRTSSGPAHWPAQVRDHAQHAQQEAGQGDARQDVKPQLLGDLGDEVTRAEAAGGGEAGAPPPAESDWLTWPASDAASPMVPYGVSPAAHDAAHSEPHATDPRQVSPGDQAQVPPGTYTLRVQAPLPGTRDAAGLHAGCPDLQQPQHHLPMMSEPMPRPLDAPPHASQNTPGGSHATAVDHGHPGASVMPAEAPAMSATGALAAAASRPGKRGRPVGPLGSVQQPANRVTRSAVHGSVRPPPATAPTSRRNGQYISDGTAANILVALQSGGTPPPAAPRVAGRRQSRTSDSDVPLYTSPEAAAEARANIGGERDALFLALRRHMPSATSKLQLSPQSVTHHVLKVVCTLNVHDSYLTKEPASETVTRLNILVPATRGPAVELPTFDLACGNREGMMLVTMLSCYVNGSNVKKTQADPPHEIRTRVKKDIMSVLAVVMRHLPRLSASLLPTLSSEDASAVAQLNYANELRSYVTFCRLLHAWRTDPHIRPRLDRLTTNPKSLPPRPPPLPNATGVGEATEDVARAAAGAGSPSPATCTNAAERGAAGAPNGTAKGTSPPMLSPSNSGNGSVAPQASADAPLTTATSAADPGTSRAAGGGGGGGGAAYDSRKVMLAQLIADQVREKMSAITSITTLSDQVEGLMSETGASGTLEGVMSGMEAKLKALQQEFDRLKGVSKTVVEELGEGADHNQLHVVLGKLAASTERMNDDVAYLVIGAKTMISETLLRDLFPDVFS